MIRRNPEAAFRSLKRRARRNAWSFAGDTFSRLVDRFLYTEDVERAFSTATLATVSADPLGRTLFVLHGFGMNEDELGIVCRMPRTRVEVVDVFRLDGS